jgi:NAD(P) transhydrogenase subunit alpha
MLIGIPRENTSGENRVAATPATVKKLIKLGFRVLVESGAGEKAHFNDRDYVAAGATTGGRAEAWGADIVLKVQAPTVAEVEQLRAGAVLLGFIWPARHPELLQKLAAKGISTLAMDQVPRISRAQKLDALSSMANIAGYRAVIEAATKFGSFFTGQMTAAGKVPPAKVMVIGAGVAGLAAIGTARGLGAIVRAFDTRPEVKDQVKSMGAEFLELDFVEEGGGEGGYAKVMSKEFIAAEMALFAKQAKDVDIIVTTALIPGKRAPVLITADMVRSMREGSVIVDLAAEQGGNCELTVPEQIVVREGVTIIGYSDLPSRLPTQASQLYGNNLVHLLDDMCKAKQPETPLDAASGLRFNLNDEVVRGTLVTHGGQITWPPPKPATVAPAPKAAASAAATSVKGKAGAATGAGQAGSRGGLFLLLAGIFLLLLGRVAPAEFLAHLTVFVLAVFIGWQVVWNVTPALHTPLMSVTNAISGIIVIGAMVQLAHPSGEGTLAAGLQAIGLESAGGGSSLAMALASVAILVAMVNVAGGFLVTHRMLGMFRKK